MVARHGCEVLSPPSLGGLFYAPAAMYTSLPMAAIGFTDWSWDLFGLAVAFAVAGVQRFWRGYLDRRSETWPISYGRIERVNVDTQDKKTKIKCYYIYKVGNESFTGSFQKTCEDADEGNAWADALAKKQVAVRYDPGNPSRSQLREVDLEPIVQAAAPFRPTRGEALTGWQHLLAVVGLVLSIVGLAITVAMVLGEILGRTVVPLKLAVWTGSLAFFVFFAGAWTFGQGKKKARAAPAWMKFLGYALFYYAVFVAVVPPRSMGRDSHTGSTRNQGGFRDARYFLFLYFSAFEWCYAQLQGNDESASYRGAGELR